MELYGIKYSETIRINVVDIDDYNINGSFNPNAASDIEFYGYRETTFKVESAEVKTATGWWPMHEDEVRYISELNDSVTLLVQNEIDKQNGEYNV
jgi:hypothetical protein